MSRPPTADFFVGRVGGVAGGVAYRCRIHTIQTPETTFCTPETAQPQNDWLHILRERRLYGAAMDIVAATTNKWLSATRQCLFGTGHTGFKRIVKHDGLRNRTRSSEYIALFCWRDACVKTSDCDSVVPTRSAADDPPPSELQCPAFPVKTF